jgi:hypothetical protein
MLPKFNQENNILNFKTNKQQYSRYIDFLI